MDLVLTNHSLWEEWIIISCVDELVFGLSVNIVQMVKHASTVLTLVCFHSLHIHFKKHSRRKYGRWGWRRGGRWLPNRWGWRNGGGKAGGAETQKGPSLKSHVSDWVGVTKLHKLEFVFVEFTSFSMTDVNAFFSFYVFQAQGGGFQKKFRKNNWKSGRKKQGKVQNGK